MSSHIGERRPLLSQRPARNSWVHFPAALSRRSSVHSFNIDERLDELQEEFESEETGVRAYTKNYQSVDFLHSYVRENARKRKLRKLKGFRGSVINAVDRSQGYLLAVGIGVATAVVASYLGRFERWLFDTRDGRCKSNWHSNKDACEDWETWSEFFEGHDIFFGDYALAIILSLFFATVSAIITVYLSASTHIDSSKDVSASALVEREDLQEEKQPQQSPSKVMYFASGSGIPEVKSIMSGFTIRGFLGARTLITKSVGLALSVASGLSLGKEGPLVTIAACLGHVFARTSEKFSRNEAKQRELLSAACAAGVSVAFAAPIGGVLFSLEEASYYFPPLSAWRSLICSTAAYITLRALSGHHKLVLFEVSYDRSVAPIELLAFVFLGIIGGVYGAVFCKANIWWSQKVRNRTWMGKHPVFEVIFITLLTAVVSYSNIFTHAGGPELIGDLFAECTPENRQELSHICIDSPLQVPNLLAALLVAASIKAILTVFTFGIKVPAGIFIPSLGVGALIGRAFGLLVEYAQSQWPNAQLFSRCYADAPFGQRCIIPGVWAICGATATLAGVTHTTISLVVIVAELTGKVTYLVPVIVTILSAKTTVDALEHRSIYDLVLIAVKLPFLDSRDEPVHDFHVPDIMDRKAEYIDTQANNTIGSLSRLVIESEKKGMATGYPLLKHRGHELALVGHIGIQELALGLARLESLPIDTPVGFNHVTLGLSQSLSGSHAVTPGFAEIGKLCDRAPLTVSTRSPMHLLQELFTKLGVRYLIVLDEEQNYAGLITKERWLAYLEFAEAKHNKKQSSPPAWLYAE